MEVVFAGLARDVSLVYLDDVLVVGKTLKEHHPVADLGRVLRVPEPPPSLSELVRNLRR